MRFTNKTKLNLNIIKKEINRLYNKLYDLILDWEKVNDKTIQLLNNLED